MFGRQAYNGTGPTVCSTWTDVDAEPFVKRMEEPSTQYLKNPESGANVHRTQSGETVTLTVLDVVYRGKGLARLDGRVVFVPGVVPGETVRARIVRSHRNFLEARLIEILEASPARTEPICPLAFRQSAGAQEGTAYCPGCTYQHMTYEEEIRLKQSQFRDILGRMAGTSDSGLPGPASMSTVPTGYRNKMVLHGGSRLSGSALGYFAEDNTTVVDVTACPLAAGPLNALLCEKRMDAGWMREAVRARRVTFRHTPHDGALEWKGRADATAPPLTETTPVGEMLVPRDSFWQVNPGVADLVVARVIQHLKQFMPDTVVDLYCGAGLFALAAAVSGVKQVFGVDSDKGAIGAASRNACCLDLNGTKFTAGSAAAAIGGILYNVRPERTTVIADPTRRGLEEGVTGRLIECRPARIIYVSCAPDTMARDVRLLRESGYSVTASELMDMFPRTPYFESVTCLEADG